MSTSIPSTLCICHVVNMYVFFEFIQSGEYFFFICHPELAVVKATFGLIFAWDDVMLKGLKGVLNMGAPPRTNKEPAVWGSFLNQSLTDLAENALQNETASCIRKDGPASFTMPLEVWRMQWRCSKHGFFDCTQLH